MSYHTTSTKSADFIASLRQARLLSNDIKNMFKENDIDITFFPYR